MRSKWKCSSSNFNLNPSDKVLRLISREPVPALLLNKRIQIYNGRKYASLIVRPYMINNLAFKYIDCKVTGASIHVRKGKNSK